MSAPTTTSSSSSLPLPASSLPRQLLHVTRTEADDDPNCWRTELRFVSIRAKTDKPGPLTDTAIIGAVDALSAQLRALGVHPTFPSPTAAPDPRLLRALGTIEQLQNRLRDTERFASSLMCKTGESRESLPGIEGGRRDMYGAVELMDWLRDTEDHLMQTRERLQGLRTLADHYMPELATFEHELCEMVKRIHLQRDRLANLKNSENYDYMHDAVTRDVQLIKRRLEHISDQARDVVVRASAESATRESSASSLSSSVVQKPVAVSAIAAKPPKKKRRRTASEATAAAEQKPCSQIISKPQTSAVIGGGAAKPVNQMPPASLVQKPTPTATAKPPDQQPAAAAPASRSHPPLAVAKPMPPVVAPQQMTAQQQQQGPAIGPTPRSTATATVGQRKILRPRRIFSTTDGGNVQARPRQQRPQKSGAKKGACTIS